MWRLFLARTLYMWGSLHRNFGNRSNFSREHRQAIRRFTQAFNLDPTLRRARLDRGIVYYRELGMLDEAISDFDALLDDDPEYGPALMNRAMIAQERGQYESALADLDSYLLLPVTDEEYWRMANRTAALLRELISDLSSKQSNSSSDTDPL